MILEKSTTYTLERSLTTTYRRDPASPGEAKEIDSASSSTRLVTTSSASMSGKDEIKEPRITFASTFGRHSGGDQ